MVRADLSPLRRHQPRVYPVVLVAILLGVLCASSGVFADAGSPETAAYEAQPRVTLAGSLAPAISTAIAGSSVPAGQSMRLAITLPLRNFDALQDLLNGLYDPFDPRYHQYLTPAQFADQFGPTQADYDALAAFASSYGLTVTGTYSNRALLDVSGSVRAVESAFHVNLVQYAGAEGSTFYGPDREASVPASLSGIVSGVFGLDSSMKLQSYIHPAARPGGGSGFDGGYTPSDTKTAYDLTSVPDTGSGQTIALFELDGYLQSDIALYQAEFNLPATVPTNILVDDAAGTGDDGEDTLDIDLAESLAPNANLLVYEAPNNGSGVLDCYARIATDDLAEQASSSWGTGSDDYPAYVTSESQSFMQMAAQGQTMFAAAGDSGAFGDGTDLSIGDPGTQPYVTAVGGTDLTTGVGAAYVSETSWGDPLDESGRALEGAGGGGGFSSVWPIPDWQAGVISAPTLGSSSRRNVPDVSFYGDYDTGGYSIALDGAWGVWNGTSAAAPLWASFNALVNQARVSGGLATIGFANPIYYEIGRSSRYATDFHDIKDGSTNLYYPAVPGYDLSTGWGSPIGANLLADLAPTASAATPTGLSATPANEEVFLSWTAVPGADGYAVGESTTASGPYTSVVTAATANNYAVSGLINGTTYYFEVSASNGKGTPSATSSPVSATPSATPAAVTNLTAAAGNANITLSWTASSGATSYTIYREEQSGSEAYTLQTQGVVPQAPYAKGVTSTTYTDTAVTNGTAYFYTVASVDSGGATGAQSVEVNAIPIAHPKPTFAATPSPTSSLASGLVLCALLNEGSGTTVLNTIDGTTATLGSGAKWITSPEGTALSDNGTSTAANFAPNTVPTSGYSVFVIGNATNSGFFGQDQDTTGGTGNVGIAITSAGMNLSYASAASGAAANLNDQLVHITLLRQPSLNYAGYDFDTLYANGLIVGEGDDIPTDNLYSTTPHQWSIGGLNQPADTISTPAAPPLAASFLNGYVNYVLVWNRQLTPTEIATLNADPYGFLVLASPNGLAVGSSNNQTTLYWNAVEGATSYNIYRGTASGDESATPIATGVTAAKYVDTAVSNGSTYYYEIAAITPGATSGMSNEASATPSATSTKVIDPLNDWTIISGKSANWALDNSLLSDFNNDHSRAYRTVADTEYLEYTFSGVTAFSAIVYAYEAPTSAVTVLYSTNGGSTYTTMPVTASSITPTVGGWGYYTFTNSGTLPSGITNTKVELTYTGVNWDPEIGQISFTYSPPTIPAPPTDLTATGGTEQVSLSWTGSAGATSYNIYRGTSSGGESATPIATGVATTAFTNSGLTDGTAYYYKVAAVNVAGTSGFSNEASATPELKAPAAPNGLAAGSSSAQTTLYWNPVSYAASYSVYRGTATGGEAAAPIATGLTTEKYVNSGLTNGTTYYYTVAAVNAAGTSGHSNEASATPSATTTTVIDPLNDFTIIGSKSANWALDTTLAVDFNGDASCAYRTVADAEYLAYNFPNVTSFRATVYAVSAPSTAITFWYSTNSGSTYTQLTATASARTATANTWGYYTYMSSGTLPAGITNLKIQNDYAGTNWDGQIGEVSITYSPPVAPPAPTGLAATAATEQVSLSWTGSTGASSYNVYRGTSSGGEAATPIATGVTATAFTNTGLTDGTTYYYKVSAVNAGGTSGFSNEASATPELAAPAAPNGLVAGSSSDQATLYWNPVSYAASYSVYRGTATGGEAAAPIATGLTTETYVNSGLTNGTTYYYTVAAVNAAGTSGHSNEAIGKPSSTSTTVIDPLNDFTIIGSKSANWALDTTLAVDFNGDASCAYRTVADAEYLAYNFPNVTSFWATVYTVSAPSTAITFWYSTNSGSTYTQLTTTVSARTATANTWGYYTYASSGTVPAGITNLKIQNDYASTSWDGQIGEVSITYTPPAAPPAPAGLAATAGNAQVSLSWTGSSGATSYSVYRGTLSGGEASTPVATGITGTTYTNTGLTNGVKYYYKVGAVGAGGTSGLSNEASATPVAPAPTGLAATAGNALITLSWTAGASAASYNVYRGTSSGGESTTPVATAVSTTAYTNTGLTNGVTYYYKVAAVSVGVTSPLSNEASATPRVPVPPSPTGLTATAGNAEAGLSWTASMGATSYDIYRGTSGDAESTTPIATGVSTAAYTNTGLTNGTAYYYEVAAVNAGGTSGVSNQASATPHVPAPLPPAGLTATAGSGQATLSWTSSVSATSYDVYRGTASGAEAAAPVATDITSTAYTNTALTNGATYYYKVSAVNAGGTSALSSEASATPKLTAPAAPTGLTASTGNTVVGLAWTAAATAASYSIYRGTSSGGESATAIVTGVTTTAYTNSGLTNGTTYYYKIAAVNAAGTSPLSSEASATPKLTAPVAPAGLTATAGSAQVTLKWTASNTAASYSVFRGTASHGESATPVASGLTATSYVNTGLSGGVAYYYTVSALNAAGTSPASAEVTATPTFPVLPPAPTGLTAKAGSTEITLSWTASSGATSYNVYRGTSSGNETSTVATGIAATSYTNTGLTNGTTYYYIVAAVNSVGTSTQSNETSATPEAAAAAVPSPAGSALDRLYCTNSSPASYNVLRGTPAGDASPPVAVHNALDGPVDRLLAVVNPPPII